MRLTLRTMLAFMDNILDSDDTQAIRKKIDENEFAGSLLQRTRDATRRMRLGAPKVLGHGVGLDPNTVAEYLDNTLGDDQLPDFERVCLESDVHLAEAASCHQILALVLGEPAEVDPRSRQRMYQLPHLPLPSAGASAEDGRSPEGATARATDDTSGEPSSGEPSLLGSTDEKTRPKRMVPDYLRDPPTKRKRRLLVVAAGLVVAGFVVVMGLAAFGRLDPGTPLGRLLGRQEENDTVAQVPDEQPANSDQVPPQPGSPTPGEDPSPGQSEQTGALGTDEAAGSPPSETPPSAPMPPDGPVELPSEPEGVAGGVLPAGPGESADPLRQPGDDALPGQPTTLPGEPAIPPGVAEPGETELANAQPVEEAPMPVAPMPVGPQRVGQFVSEAEILLRYDSKSASWQRLPPHETLSDGESLLALPTFRPQVALTSGITVQSVDSTYAQFLKADADSPPGLQVFFGRVILRSAGQPGARFRLRVGNVTGVIRFDDSESTVVAVEVIPRSDPGVDPAEHPGYVSADLYTQTGQVQWVGADQQPIAIKAPAWLTLDERAEVPITVEQFPRWLREDTSNPMDRDTSAIIQQGVRPDRSVSLSLKELSEHRRKEVRRLALRCLGVTAQFDPLVAALDDPDEKFFWSNLDPFLSALSRGPQTAVQLRQAMVRRFGEEEGRQIYDLLWQNPAETPTYDEVKQRIDLLKNPRLAMRVVGHWSLNRMTTLAASYRPDDPAKEREQAADRLERALDSKRIPIKDGIEPPEDVD
ncbi:MAG: hypothetical protein HQ581_25565 [Planctomycetes bacterium]|nr:hypothetical protein [Planctomycetota bacterium]